MMDLGKVKSALHRAGMLLAGQMYHTDYIEEALAELEKPAEDLLSLAEECCLLGNVEGAPMDDENISECARLIQQYAESYHAKKCAECKHSTWCSFRGVPITIVTCENCSTYPCDKCAKNETCDFENYETQCNGKFLEPLPEAPRA